jgi:hypothetical protein
MQLSSKSHSLPTLARAASAAALILSLASTAAAEWGDWRKKLDRYESQAKEMHQRAQQQLQQLEKDARGLLNRWASEVVDKPIYGNKGIYGNNEVLGCYAPSPSWNLLTGEQPPTAPAVYYTRGQFDAWMNAYLGVFAQIQKNLDTAYNNQLHQVAEFRREYDQIEQYASRFHFGTDRKQAMAAGLPWYKFPNFYTLTYLDVLDGYIQLLYLGKWAIAGPPFTATPSGVLPPPGQTCFIASETSKTEFTDQIRMAQAGEIWERTDRKGTYGKIYVECGAACQQLEAVCSEHEEHSRDAAASKLYTFLNRSYAERKQIRERMLQWRKDCVNAGWYDGTGDAAISAVYRTEADLSTENVDGLANTGEVSINLATQCLDETVGPTQLTVKYPDLETERPYLLKIPFRTPRILEGIASGAARTERP